MHKILAYSSFLLIMLIIVSSAAMAKTIDQECKDEFGLDAFGIAGFQATGFKMVHEMKDYDLSGYNIGLAGDEYNATWTAGIPIKGVVVKTGSDTEAFTGGTAGLIHTWEFSDKHKMTDITFCGGSSSSGGDDEDPSGVPEFSFVTLGAAVALAGLGLAYFRKN